MKLSHVELFHLHLPRISVYETSLGTHAARHTLLVKARVDGAEGWGEFAGDGPGFSYETTQTAAHILRDHLIPITAEKPFGSVGEAHARWTAVRGHPFAKAALECALWDAECHLRGVSLRAVLEQLTGFVLCDAIPVGVSVGIQPSIERTLARARKLMEFNPPRIKLKIKPGHEVLHVRAVREAFPQVPLSVDGNGVFDMRHLRVFQELDELNLMMIEQPFAPDNFSQHAQLQRAIKTPICLDESICGYHDIATALAMNACRIINIKPGRVGGLLNVFVAHELCQQFNVPMWCGGMYETGIGRAFNAFVAALPGFTLPADCTPPERAYGFDLVEPVLAFNNNSELIVPSGPGLGVRVNEARVSEFSTSRVTVHVDA